MAYQILTCVPAFGQIITATTFLTTHALSQALMQRGIGGGITTLSFPDIAELRGMFTTLFYDTVPTATHMLLVDADMGFSPDLVLEMLLLDEPIVGTIYPQRKLNVTPDGRTILPPSWAGSGSGEPVTERRGNFMKVEGVGMGCTLIRRDAITTMLEKMPECIDTRLHLHPAKETMFAAGAKRLLRLWEKIDLPERGIVSEDLSFCLRWNKCGGTVWGAIGHKITHVGPYAFEGRYLDQIELQQAQMPVPQGQQIIIPALPEQASTTEPELGIVPPPMPEVPQQVAAE